MNNIIKIVLAILFFICLADMPYGYFQFVRFLALIGFFLFAFEELQKENQKLLITYIALAILFQPFVKISLGREMWNVLDVIVATWLLISSLNKNHTSGT